MIPMSGILCLQGGREFTPECREMDADVISSAGVRSAAVLAGAARVGSDYAGASMRASRHYAGLGLELAVIPDPRVDATGTLAAMDHQLDLLVLPGGSPSSLLEVLSGDVGERLLALHAGGTAISGASAGAMVLCTSMVRPDRGGDVVAGLGLVDGLALPHWKPGRHPGWTVPDGTVWGLPECGGVVSDGDDWRSVGAGTPSVRLDGEWRPVARRIPATPERPARDT